MFFRRVFEAVFMIAIPRFKFSLCESYVAERLARGGNYCFVYDARFQAVTVQRAVVFCRQLQVRSGSVVVVVLLSIFLLCADIIWPMLGSVLSLILMVFLLNSLLSG